MNIVKYLKILLFGPLLPMFSIPDTDNGENKNDSITEKKDNGSSKDSGQKDNSKNDDKKSYSEDDVNRIVSDRLKRETDKITKQVKAEFDEQKRKDNLSENERLKEEKKEIEKNANLTIEKANKKLILAEVKLKATELKIIDSDAAYSLMNKDNIEVNDDGTISGVEESLKDLIKSKTYLVKDFEDTNINSKNNVGDDQQGKDNKNKNLTMNALIRKSAGY